MIDVTDSNNPQELNGSIGGSKNNATITLTPAGAGTKALLAFTDARVMSATVKANVPSNWQEEGLQHDYVMITTGELKASLTPLKALRESQGLSVTVVEVEDLYDEFSFGNKSPQAIKDFLMFTRDNWRQTPRFVLFAGDSSYDPKNYLGSGQRSGPDEAIRQLLHGSRERRLVRGLPGDRVAVDGQRAVAGAKRCRSGGVCCKDHWL